MTRLATALLSIGAAAVGACTSFGNGSTGGDVADADTATGVDGGGAACWPNGRCTGNQICCVAADGSSACVLQAECPSDHGRLACLRPSDCDGGQCCVRGSQVVDGGSATYYPTSACASAECPTSAGSNRICEGQADCLSGTTCTVEPKFVPSNISLCIK